MITFIIGTDTDVGKTYYGKKLIDEGKKLIKPIETGKNSFQNINLSDCYQYARLQNRNIEEINLYFFSEAVSPHLAAEIDNLFIDIKLLKSFILEKKDAFVELAGGLYVPLTRGYTQLDLLKEISKIEKIHVDLVIDNKLGCINHALLTIHVLRDNHIPIREVFINSKGKVKAKIMLDNERVIMDFIGNGIQR